MPVSIKQPLSHVKKKKKVQKLLTIFKIIFLKKREKMTRKIKGGKKGELSVVWEPEGSGCDWDGAPPIPSRVPSAVSTAAPGHLPSRSWSGLSHPHVEKEKDLTPSKRP